MLITIPKNELDKAQEELNIAVANGFIASDATFKADSLDKYGGLILKFDLLILKAHQTNGCLNWGCHYDTFHRDHKVVCGRLERIEK